MKSIKLSRYNFQFFHDGNYYLYNSFSNALVDAPQEIARLVSGEEDTVDIFSTLSKELLLPLIRGGFLVEASKNELAQLKVRNRIGRFANRELGLTIAPTLDCNFRCSYCFEGHDRSTMSAETVDAVYDYVLGALQGMQGLGVCWYGGEPLLAFDTMEKLSSRFIRLCRTLETPYEADIISNGYLMSVEKAEKLTRKMGVRFWQVTLDGPQEVHDQRRPLHGGEGSFDVVLNNLVATSHLFDRVSVRINIDRTNREHVGELLDQLEQKGLCDKVTIYFGHVQAIGAACPSFSHHCLSTKEFSRVEMDLMRQVADRGWPLSLRPRLKTGVCLVDQVNCYLVDPSGNLAKCWNCAGVEEERTGTIFDDKPHENLFRWLSFDPFDDPECLECNMLPICMGGCPYDKIIAGKKDCFTQKYNLIDRQKLRIDEKKQAANKKGDRHARKREEGSGGGIRKDPVS